MKVTIGDMDYYYHPSRKNAFNPDAMKISSYHKQLGDQINFVVKQDDIHRPFDLYYIIKEKESTPNPPPTFYLDKNVRWGGKAFRMRINWRMSDAMLGCRPDYLLYPEKQTVEERAEQLRLFNNQGKPLTWIQDYTNTFKRKKILITDPAFGYASKEDIVDALIKLQDLPKISFLEPIWIQKIMKYPEIKDNFMKLHFLPGASFTGSPISIEQGEETKQFLLELRYSVTTHIAVGSVMIDYRNRRAEHGEDRDAALHDFKDLCNLCLDAKANAININIRMPASRLETPYFAIFEALSTGTQYYFQLSGLEFLTTFYGKVNRVNYIYYGNHPEEGSDMFRDLLRQTYQDHNFLLTKGQESKWSINEIPWQLGDKQFEYGI